VNIHLLSNILMINVPLALEISLWLPLHETRSLFFRDRSISHVDYSPMSRVFDSKSAMSNKRSGATLMLGSFYISVLIDILHIYLSFWIKMEFLEFISSASIDMVLGFFLLVLFRQPFPIMWESPSHESQF